MSFAARLRKSFTPAEAAAVHGPAQPKKQLPTFTRMDGATLRAVCRCGVELVLASGWIASDASRHEWIEEAAANEGWRGGRCAACAEAERLEKKV